MGFEDAAEVESGVAVAEFEGFIRRDVCPADRVGVAQHRVLDGRTFRHSNTRIVFTICKPFDMIRLGIAYEVPVGSRTLSPVKSDRALVFIWVRLLIRQKQGRNSYT